MSVRCVFLLVSDRNIAGYRRGDEGNSGLKGLIAGHCPTLTNFVAGISAHNDSLVCVGVNYFITRS